MRRNIIILHIILLTVYSYAESYTYGFLSLPVSSRVNALGGSNVSIRDGELSMAMINPALLNEQTHMVGQMSFAYYGGMSMFGSIAYGHNYKGHLFAAGLHYLDFGKFQYADELGYRNGDTFSCKNFVLNLTYAHDLGKLFSIGASIKPLYSVFEQYTSWGLGFDFGVYMHTPDSSFTMGLAVKNFGAELKGYYKYEGTWQRELLPYDIEFGMSYKFAHAPLRLSLTAHDLQQWKIIYTNNSKQESVLQGMTSTSNTVKWYDNFFRHIIFSIDIVPKSDKYYITLSYNHARRKELSLQNRRGLSGFALGAGIRIKQFRLGFALSQYQVGNFAYQVSLSSSIGDFLK